MGTAARPAGKLADALFSSTQRRVLELFFLAPERAFTLAEVIRAARAGRGAVQREVARLVDAGLLRSALAHGSRVYQANADCPIFPEIAAIIRKTRGITEAIAARLSSLDDRIAFAAVYGSVAKGTDRSASDVDVLIVSDDLLLEDVFAALGSLEEELGRKINPLVLSVDEFARRRASGRGFLASVLNGPHTVLLGSSDAVSPR